MNEGHILSNFFDPPVELPKYKIGDRLYIEWDDEVAVVEITGFADRAGEFVYNVLLWIIGPYVDVKNYDQAIDYWIFPSMIIEIN